jgi:uncharacterized protein (UPF0333 family)
VHNGGQFLSYPFGDDREYIYIVEILVSNRMRAQVSMEYIIIVGFLMVILIPLFMVYSDVSKQTHDKVLVNEFYQVARKAADEVETIYFIGDPARTRVKIFLPADLTNATIENQEIVLTAHVYGNSDEIVVPTKVHMNGSFPMTKGVHNLLLQAKGNWVEISE